jgi:hypothetical protein
MLRILSEGEDRHRLESASGARVGWIHGHAIGFRGIESESAAMRAAVPAARALEAILLREYPGRPRHESSAAVKLVRDGAYEWIAAGAHPLARLLRPVDDRPSDPFDSTFGIELVLPSYSTEGVAIQAAEALSRALALDASAHPPHGADRDATARADV